MSGTKNAHSKQGETVIEIHAMMRMFNGYSRTILSHFPTLGGLAAQLTADILNPHEFDPDRARNVVAVMSVLATVPITEKIPQDDPGLFPEALGVTLANLLIHKLHILGRGAEDPLRYAAPFFFGFYWLYENGPMRAAETFATHPLLRKLSEIDCFPDDRELAAKLIRDSFDLPKTITDFDQVHVEKASEKAAAAEELQKRLQKMYPTQFGQYTLKKKCPPS